MIGQLTKQGSATPDNPARPTVTAIIATLAEAGRRDSLLRAVDSLLASTRNAELTILAVVNGNRFAPGVVCELAARGARIVQIAESSLPAAMLKGRQATDSEYFCFLDDDDEYLPGAIDARLEVLHSAPGCAIVISNGLRRSDGVDMPALEHLANVPADPLRALFEENWLPSCGALFRTDEVGVEFFERPHQYLEWTWLAFCLARAGKGVAVLEQPTFRIHDTPSSLSKSQAYSSSHVDLYRRMLNAQLPGQVRGMLRKRLVKALNSQSVAALAKNDLPIAWRCHLQALGVPQGWRYGSQTVRLITASVRRLVAPAGPRA